MNARVSKLKLCSSIIAFQLVAVVSQGMTVEQYLEMVKSRNKLFQSYDSSGQAAETRQQKGDLDLSPVLTMKGTYLDDKARSTSSTMTLTHNEVRKYSLGLAKKFSSGTAFSAEASLQAIHPSYVDAAQNGYSYEYHTGALELGFTQSLWKDFFGHGTRLRHERESSQKAYEKSAYDLQKQQVLIQAEAVFWDLQTKLEQLQIRRDGLERARKIESWVHRRFDNGIGNRSDLLNAQSLVASRELELLVAQDELLAIEKDFADQVGWPEETPLPKIEGGSQASGSLPVLLEGKGSSRGRMVRLDTYMNVLDAKAKSVVALESKDQLRPDLSIFGSYKTNTYQDSDVKNVSHLTDKDYPGTTVGVQLTWLLDWETKNAIRSTADQDALAAQLKKEYALRQSDTAWAELHRRHAELGKKIEAAKKISQIQTAKAASERDLLSKGRTVTSQVVIAEQDAAEAQLNFIKLLSEQRKLESQVRLFVSIEESL